MESIPLFDHDPSEARNPLSRPPLRWKGGPLPRRCLMSFMNDVLLAHCEERHLPVADIIHSETCDYPIYIDEDTAGELCLVHAPVGASASAIVADLLIDSGVDSLMACGGCGVLVPIAQGKLLVPKAALRDEGVSYHYLSPASEVRLSEKMVSLTMEVLEGLDAPCEVVRVWTSDGFFRETAALVERRRAEGYQAVDMECASLAAVAEHYDVRFMEVLYSGDSLQAEGGHDERDWLQDMSARQAAFEGALEVLSALGR